MELRLDKVSKKYGSKIAVDEINLKLENGVYGLLGANGAGKTTLMRLLCDVLNCSMGTIYCNGEKIQDMGEEYRNLLGYLPQNFGYYPEFSAYRFLMYMACLKGLPKRYAKEKVLELLDTVELLNVMDKKIKTFSGGMKQRLGIAQAMLNDPKILILDEPTAGLDPKERVRFRNIISGFSKDKIVLLSTHIVADVEYIAGTILLMKDGKIILNGSAHKITKKVEGYVWELKVPSLEAENLVNHYHIANMRYVGDDTVLRIIEKEAPDHLAKQVIPNLEDLYLYYFG